MNQFTRQAMIWVSVAVLTSPAVVRAQFAYSNNGDSTCTITDYGGQGGNVTIPGTINGLRVTSIGGYAFQYKNGLKSIVIPASVTNIGAGAFYSCQGLTNAVIGSGVTSIGAEAFSTCINLKSIVIPASVTNIATYAFDGCTKLTQIYFRGNAPSLGTSVFADGTPAIIYYQPNTTGWGSFAGPTPVLWNPTAKPDATFGVQANCFGLTITNAGSPTIIVDACTNLSGGIWVPVSTNSLTNGSSYFSDPAWTNYHNRFYRFRAP